MNKDLEWLLRDIPGRSLSMREAMERIATNLNAGLEALERKDAIHDHNTTVQERRIDAAELGIRNLDSRIERLDVAKREASAQARMSRYAQGTQIELLQTQVAGLVEADRENRGRIVQLEEAAAQNTEYHEATFDDFEHRIAALEAGAAEHNSLAAHTIVKLEQRVFDLEEGSPSAARASGAPLQIHVQQPSNGGNFGGNSPEPVHDYGVETEGCDACSIPTPATELTIDDFLNLMRGGFVETPTVTSFVPPGPTIADTLRADIRALQTAVKALEAAGEGEEKKYREEQKNWGKSVIDTPDYRDAQEAQNRTWRELLAKTTLDPGPPICQWASC